MRPRGVLLTILFTAELLVMLDGMSVSVALPEIGDDVGLEGAELQFVVTAYTVPLGSFLLLGGRAADRWGRRRMLGGGLVAFALGSLAAGLARDAGVLLGGRAVSGVGAAFAIPAALGLVTAVTSPGRERNRVLGLMAAIQAFGVVAGAALGGVVTYTLGWPWVFLVLAPVAAAAAVGARLLPESGGDDAEQPLDWAGATAVALGLALLILALVDVQREGLGGAAAPALAGSLILLALFVLRQRAARAPLLPLRLFRSTRVTGANVTVVANAGAFTGTVVLSTLLMQRELGFSALEAGLGFAPLSLSAFAGCLLAPTLIERAGPRAFGGGEPDDDRRGARLDRRRSTGRLRRHAGSGVRPGRLHVRRRRGAPHRGGGRGCRARRACGGRGAVPDVHPRGRCRGARRARGLRCRVGPARRVRCGRRGARDGGGSGPGASAGAPPTLERG